MDQCFESGLQLDRIDLLGVVIDLQHEPQAGKDGFGQLRVPVGQGATVGVGEDGFDPSSDRRVVSVAWQEDEHGDETSEELAPREHTHPSPLLQARDGHRDLEQLIDIHLDEVVAWVPLEDGAEPLLVMAAGREAGSAITSRRSAGPVGCGRGCSCRPPR